jgi:hypothetical protein
VLAVVLLAYRAAVVVLLRFTPASYCWYSLLCWIVCCHSAVLLCCCVVLLCCCVAVLLHCCCGHDKCLLASIPHDFVRSILLFWPRAA